MKAGEVNDSFRTIADCISELLEIDTIHIPHTFSKNTKVEKTEIINNLEFLLFILNKV